MISIYLLLDALNFNFCPLVVVRLFVAIAHLLEQRTDIVYNWPCVPGSIPGGTPVKESFFGVTLFLLPEQIQGA